MAKVLIVDAGARGHALALKYLESQKVDEVIVAPGNEGMKNNFINKYDTKKISIDPRASLKDPVSVLELAKEYLPDLIDVAQDDALALGTVDLLKSEGFPAFGPTKSASEIEWNKEWSREFMDRHKIPSPEYRSFNSTEGASQYAQELLDKKGEIFFKASGLYAGKGVIPVKSKSEIQEALSKIEKMGQASKTFLIEEGLQGEEFSYYAISDGKNFACFKSSQDNKRVWNKDCGPNTGGMGCNAPALVTEGLKDRIEKEIIEPAVNGLAKEGRPYIGILYLGGMFNPTDQSIKVVEFNSRWGDPECHVILPSINGPIPYFDLVNLAMSGPESLKGIKLSEDNLTRVCIIGASTGYPGDYKNAKKILINHSGIPNGVHLLSAGTKIKDNILQTNGGRVFSVVASGSNILEARTKALQAMACCSIEDNGLHYRTDIAWRDAERLQRENK